MTEQPHLKLKPGDVAPVVLLPGEPQRIDLITVGWENVREVAYNREFRTVTGTYRGKQLSVTSTGIGCPSAAIAVEELCEVGAETFIRIGTCGALRKNIRPGDIIIPYAAIRAEGTTREYLPPEYPAVADYKIVAKLKEVADEKKITAHLGIDRCHDAFYEPVGNILRWAIPYQDDRMKKWPYPLVSSEMECSAVFLIASLRGRRAGAVLAVNTVEPLNEIAANPASVYEIIQSPEAAAGLQRTIAVGTDAAWALAE